VARSLQSVSTRAAPPRSGSNASSGGRRESCVSIRRNRDPSSRESTGAIAAFAKFSDGFPLLVIASASLAELNTRLAKPLPMERFRPNLVLDGCDAFAEDSLHAIEVGGVRLHLVKACTRCSITTTDQNTGERDGVEPLETLKTYRWDAQLKGVIFGQNAIVAAGAGRVIERGMQVLPAD
jgi:uncharacterized protein YcbX